jgi:DNA-binding response OmpR family regulator
MGDPEKTKVLVVDDERMTNRVIERMLRRWGIEVITTSSPTSVLSLMKEHRPTLVIIDVRMPALEGTSVVKLIREDPAVGKTTILLHSALDDTVLALEARQCGADGYIPKASGINYLERHLNRWIRKLRE